MDSKEAPFYTIQIEGHLTDAWSSWFEELEIRRASDGTTTLSGYLPDQASLFGVLSKIYSLNLTLLSVNRA